MRHLGRRAFLISAVLFSPLGLRRGRAQTTTLDDFMRLSRRLTGRSSLDPEVGAIYVKALLAVPAHVQPLADLSRGTVAGAQMTPAHVAVEDAILTSWYTGTYQVNGQTQLATHTGALVWSAIGRPAPGTCVGATGSWSKPPQSVARMHARTREKSVLPELLELPVRE